MPDNGVAEGNTGGPVPDHGRLTLVGHTDSSDVLGINTALLQSAGNDFLDMLPDFHRVMFHPARPRVNLLVFFLLDGNYRARPVEDHAAGASSTLINSGDVGCGHCKTLTPTLSRYAGEGAKKG